MSKYLVTGFEAFGEDSLNPTEQILKWIREDQNLSSLFDTQLLPVEYDRAHRLILDRTDLDSFDGIICLGLAGGRSKISIERVGLNWTESRQPDNAGNIPDKGIIDLEAERAYFTEFHMDSLKAQLEDANLPVEISLSAGGYVCNHLYFNLLKNLVSPWVVFIHVPFLEVQMETKPMGIPFFTESQMRKFLEILVQSFRAH